MKRIGALLCFAILIASAVASGQCSNPNVLMRWGLLTRDSKAGTSWTLSITDPRDEIVRATFNTPTDNESLFYAAFDGKKVVLEGLVGNVSKGTAALTEIHFIRIDRYSEIYPHDAAPVARPETSSRIPYKHAYYLFIDGFAGRAKDCAVWYVPLLVTQRPLEEIAKGTDIGQSVLIFTHERDSIWEMGGAMPVVPKAIEAAPRIIHALGMAYRYQEISASEVVNLLEHPLGTIPISRISMSLPAQTVPGAGFSDLIHDFQALLK
jgi:hypothetical protein